MGFIRAQHIFKSKSGLPLDDVVNTFYFTKTGAVTEADCDTLDPLIREFYDQQVTPPGAGLHEYLGEASMATNRHLTKYYDMEDSEPRVPLASLGSAPGLANNSQPTLPAEVALCLSFKGAPLGGAIPARRRGRLYLGPWNTGALASGPNGYAVPHANLIAAALQCGKRLQDNASTAGFTWVVYSPTTFDLDPGETSFAGRVTITDFWCDNAWDTQRRRGMKATTRSVLAA